MTDQHDPKEQPSFHWPPTAEELDTIQVADLQGRPIRPGDTRQWRTGVAKASIAQIGVLAASLAAIGIALTSMLATPAQPVGRAARGQAAAAVAATRPAGVASVDDTTAFDKTPAFRPMVVLDLEKPSAADIRGSQEQTSTRNAPDHAPRASNAAAAGVAVGSAGAARASATDARVRLASAEARPTRAARTSERRLAKREAPRDPVARFAVHTGKSVWKAMRAVGRTIKHQGDEDYFATRSANARRTARAVSLQAENAPSDR